MLGVWEESQRNIHKNFKFQSLISVIMAKLSNEWLLTILIKSYAD